MGTIDFDKNAKIFLWITCFLIALCLFLLPIVYSSTSVSMYEKGYEANGAYDRLPYSQVWQVTDNVQGFFKGENDLLYFPSNEAAHLEEVKDVLNFGKQVVAVLFIMMVISASLFFRFSYQKNFGTIKKRLSLCSDFKTKKKKVFLLKILSETMQKSSYLLFGLIVLFSLLALSWDWFFILFHELLFSGQWIFPTNTLMISLWGDSFFIIAAKFIALRIIAYVLVLYVLSHLASIFQKKVAK